MKAIKIKSYAKVNLSLAVLGKSKSKLHKIETIVTFINLYDEIFIKETNKNRNSVIFIGPFAKNITKKNTITKLLDILDKKKFLKNKKYIIRINKKIPQKSGMGGGSMNAASLLKYLIYKNKIKLNINEIIDICNKVGSDVALGLERKTSLLKNNGKIIRFKKKLKFYLLIVKPNFGCSTKEIYRNFKIFSKPKLERNIRNLLFTNKLSNLKNDLEIPAFKRHPALLKLKKNVLKIPKIKFARMTGSGSCIIGYFGSKKASLNGFKKIKKLYNNYWCTLSKTI